MFCLSVCLSVWTNAFLVYHESALTNALISRRTGIHKKNDSRTFVLSIFLSCAASRFFPDPPKASAVRHCLNRIGTAAAAGRGGGDTAQRDRSAAIRLIFQELAKLSKAKIKSGALDAKAIKRCLPSLPNLEALWGGRRRS